MYLTLLHPAKSFYDDNNWKKNTYPIQNADSCFGNPLREIDAILTNGSEEIILVVTSKWRLSNQHLVK